MFLYWLVKGQQKPPALKISGAVTNNLKKNKEVIVGKKKKRPQAIFILAKKTTGNLFSYPEQLVRQQKMVNTNKWILIIHLRM